MIRQPRHYRVSTEVSHCAQGLFFLFSVNGDVIGGMLENAASNFSVEMGKDSPERQGP